MKNSYVYTLRDAAGTVLYIGCSNDVPNRIEQHRRDKPWADQIAEIVTDEFATRMEAEAFERDAIQRYQPAHNVRLRNPGPRRQAHGSHVQQTTITIPEADMRRLRAEASALGITVAKHVVNLLRLSWALQDAATDRAA